MKNLLDSLGNSWKNFGIIFEGVIERILGKIEKKNSTGLWQNPNEILGIILETISEIISEELAEEIPRFFFLSLTERIIEEPLVKLLNKVLNKFLKKILTIPKSLKNKQRNSPQNLRKIYLRKSWKNKVKKFFPTDLWQIHDIILRRKFETIFERISEVIFGEIPQKVFFCFY